MNWLAVIPKRLLVELAGVAVVALALWARWEHVERLVAQDALTAYKAAQAQAVADAVNAAQVKTQEAERNNAAILNDLQGKLDQSVADGTRTTVRLRNALARIGACPVSAGGGQPGTAPPPADTIAERAAQLVGDVTAECERNNAQLDALIGEIKPQL